ncbi:MAG TPA: hypothetical protein VMT52_14120, partial [Planctomycetota bacterium]|nr:hypothetical protein [Planctomycetota bacterium]
MRRTARSPGFSVHAAVVAALALVLVPRITEAALSPEDRVYADFLIKELRYYDTALRWLEGLEKGGRLDQATQADIASMRIEVLKGQGRSEEALEAVAEFQRKFPNDPRASVGDLHGIAEAMRKVLELFDRSNVEGDAAKSAALRAEGAKTFEEEVSKPLEALIADLQKRVEESRAKPSEKEKRAPAARGAGSPRASVLMQSLHYSELVRLQFHLAYARKLAEGSPERTAVLQKGFKLAQDFVQNRYEFPVMQYEAQLNLGAVAHELGRHDFAEEELSVLYELTPPFAPPYTKELVDSFKSIRLQAILFGARAKSAGRNYQRAVEIIEANFVKRRKDDFDLIDAENDPAHKTYAVLVRLEHAIALAGSGSPQRAFNVIDKVIEKPGQPMALVTDARKALGKIALMGGVRLRGKDYYQAGIGLKSERNWGAALETFQQALGSLNPRDLKEKAEMAPLCLNEIGEINFLLERYTESALAYQEVFSYFSDAPQDLLSKVATNFLAATTRAIKAGGGTAHTGLTMLKEEATKESERYSSGFQIYESMVFDAKNLELEGKYAKAREKYLEIARELKGQKVPFYWFAQASAWSCVYYQWDQADPAGKKALLSEIAAARAALPEVIEKGLGEKDRRGAAKASLILGLIHYQHGEWQDASRVLRVFAGVLADEPTFRCTGLGSLILAQVKTRELKEAARNLKSLYADCKQAAVVATAALAIADAFEEAGKLKEAALYGLFYARHPASRS